MSDSVPAVVGEWRSSDKLDADLGRDRKGSEGGRDGGRLEVETQERGGGVGGEVGVEGAGEGNASDAVEGGHDPGELGLVDAEMGRDGAAETLGGENLVALGLGGGGGVVGGGGAGVVLDHC